jgi:1,6-anhydro-N-acetylmuramate kinase
MRTFHIGLISGTSMDGIDAVLLDLGKGAPQLLGHHRKAYSEGLRAKLASLGQPVDYEIDRLGELDVQVTDIESTTWLGITPDWAEATAFACLAECRLVGIPGNLAAVTGARHAVILGGCYASQSHRAERTDRL